MSGNAIAVIAKPIVEMPRLASEKLRSPEEAERHQRLWRLRACQNTNSAKTTRPAMISRRHREIPVIVHQSYW